MNVFGDGSNEDETILSIINTEYIQLINYYKFDRKEYFKITLQDVETALWIKKEEFQKLGIDVK